MIPLSEFLSQKLCLNIGYINNSGLFINLIIYVKKIEILKTFQYSKHLKDHLNSF